MPVRPFRCETSNLPPSVPDSEMEYAVNEPIFASFQFGICAFERAGWSEARRPRTRFDGRGAAFVWGTGATGPVAGERCATVRPKREL